MPGQNEMQTDPGVGVFFSRQDDHPVIPMGKRLLPPKKAKHGVDSRSSGICKQQAANWRAVAAVRLGRQQPGILS
jgi:hypothetical protein